LEKIAIYGAKSLALGTCMAIRELYPECQLYGFIVKSLKGNPHKLAELSVHELHTVKDKNMHILIATPENLHQAIVADLQYAGFSRYTCMNSQKESLLMERYFAKIGRFRSLHTFLHGKYGANLCVYMARFHKDSILQKTLEKPDWLIPVQAGAALTELRLEEIADDQGENISIKNVNYSELTVLYWMWKNKLMSNDQKKADYYGLCHYRRMLDIHRDDICCLMNNRIDVILPFPLLHAPNILEHHTRYIKEEDWKAMYKALEELQPEYARVFDEIFKQPYFYNYNIIIAKTNVMKDYCSWLFPILERTEELSNPKGWERADRYIGYLGENLLTLYFIYHMNDLQIAHTGCNMLL